MLAFLIGTRPFLDHRRFYTADGLMLGDAGVGDAVQVAREQGVLVGGREVAVLRDADVVLVGDEVEHILLEIGAGAADPMDLAGADHLRQRQPDLGRAHRPGERHQHLAAALEVGAVGARGVHERRPIEVAEVVAHKARDGLAVVHRLSPWVRARRVGNYPAHRKAAWPRDYHGGRQRHRGAFWRACDKVLVEGPPRFERARRAIRHVQDRDLERELHPHAVGAGAWLARRLSGGVRGREDLQRYGAPLEAGIELA